MYCIQYIFDFPTKMNSPFRKIILHLYEDIWGNFAFLGGNNSTSWSTKLSALGPSHCKDFLKEYTKILYTMHPW